MFDLNVRVSASFPWRPKRATELQADPGVVRVLSPDGREPWGFGYIEPTEGGQIERWLLYRDLNDHFMFAPAPLVEMATPDLEGWKRLVASVAKPGKWYRYIKAISEVFTDEIPRPLPAPLDPLEHGRRRVIVYQTDTGGRITQAERWAGYVWSFHEPYEANHDPTKTVKHRSSEYWLLSGDFVPAGTFPGPGTKLEKRDTRVDGPEGFAEEMRNHWDAEARFVITGCMNFDGALPPRDEL